MLSLKDTLDFLSRIVEKILQNPAEVKFRTLKTTSAVFQAKVASKIGALAILHHLGFVEEQGKPGFLFLKHVDQAMLSAELEKMQKVVNHAGM